MELRNINSLDDLLKYADTRKERVFQTPAEIEDFLVEYAGDIKALIEDRYKGKTNSKQLAIQDVASSNGIKIDSKDLERLGDRVINDII